MQYRLVDVLVTTVPDVPTTFRLLLLKRSEAVSTEAVFQPFIKKNEELFEELSLALGTGERSFGDWEVTPSLKYEPSLTGLEEDTGALTLTLPHGTGLSCSSPQFLECLLKDEDGRLAYKDEIKRYRDRFAVLNMDPNVRVKTLTVTKKDGDFFSKFAGDDSYKARDARRVDRVATSVVPAEGEGEEETVAVEAPMPIVERSAARHEEYVKARFFGASQASTECILAFAFNEGFVTREKMREALEKLVVTCLNKACLNPDAIRVELGGNDGKSLKLHSGAHLNSLVRLSMSSKESSFFGLKGKLQATTFGGGRDVSLLGSPLQEVERGLRKDPVPKEPFTVILSGEVFFERTSAIEGVGNVFVAGQFRASDPTRICSNPIVSMGFPGATINVSLVGVSNANPKITYESDAIIHLYFQGV